MEQIKDKVIDKSYLFYSIAFGIGIIIILILDFRDKEFSYHDILVEAHGLIYDLIVFGILLAIYDSFKHKREEIIKLEGEIEDFRQWEKEESTHRIVGNIRRLYDLGVTKFYLNNCYLIDAHLSDYNFEGSYFSFAKMKNSSLTRSNLHSAKMVATDLENAYLTKANFENTNLEHANLTSAKLTVANFRGANLSKANMTKAEIISSEFEGANMSKVELDNAIVDDLFWIKNLKKKRIKGAKKIKKKYFVDKESRFIHNGLEAYKIRRKKSTTKKI